MPGNPFYQSPEWRALKKACLDRDKHRCVVAGCCNRATFADHIVARPRGAKAMTRADTLDNLRSLCRDHDNQIKEDASGNRRNGGVAFVRGCDASGFPSDPNHPWARQRK